MKNLFNELNCDNDDLMMLVLLSTKQINSDKETYLNFMTKSTVNSSNDYFHETYNELFIEVLVYMFSQRKLTVETISRLIDETDNYFVTLQLYLCNQLNEEQVKQLVVDPTKQFDILNSK